MSRDFLLVLGGGVVSLITTLVVLFITDLIYRRDHPRKASGATEAESLSKSAGRDEGKTKAIQGNP